MPAPDLLTRAAHFFLLAEQSSHLSRSSRTMFWEMSVSPVRDPTACLPALAAAVRKAEERGILLEPALHPLPDVLLPEAVPWYDRLVNAWKFHRASRNVYRRECARLALMRLDGCGMPDGMERPSRLPEWLAEARQIVGAGYEPARTEPARTEPARTEPARTGKWQIEELKALAALANWRPARGVITPPETLREWVAFWREMRQSRSPLLKGVAAKALWNLPEADLRGTSLPVVPARRLLRDLAAAIPAAAYLPPLDWQPRENSPLPAAGMAEVARAWLKIALHNDWWCREMIWQQLIRWDRTGSLASCGIDLLPFLVRAVQTEENGFVLWQMAQWRTVPERFTGTEKLDRLDLLREFEAHWQRHRQSGRWPVRASAWLAGIRLHQAGLATEPPDSFREAYLSAVAKEDDREVLFVLAQWSPGAAAPAAFHRKWRQGWQSRLRGKDEGIRHVAAFALLRRTLGNETGEGLRRAALEMWRTGTNEGQTARQILDTVLFRFHEVRAELAAGRVPDFEEEPVPPVQRRYPHLALPPGHIADRKWEIENEKLRIEN